MSTGNGGDWAASAGTNEIDTEWIINPSDDWTNLGVHTFNGACAVDNTGCTDAGAVNYDPTATEDDGSCIFIPSLSIQDIQTQGFSGSVVTSGVVTAIYGNNGALAGQPSYVIQNGAGANSAIWVIGDGVAVGDQVEVVLVLVFFGCELPIAPIFDFLDRLAGYALRTHFYKGLMYNLSLIHI